MLYKSCLGERGKIQCNSLRTDYVKYHELISTSKLIITGGAKLRFSLSSPVRFSHYTLVSGMHTVPAICVHPTPTISILLE